MSDYRKAGRPKKSTSEKGVRTSSMLKPEYRKIIDNLCASRQCSISDVLELCIYQYAIQMGILDKHAEKDAFVKAFYDAISDDEKNELIASLHKVIMTVQPEAFREKGSVLTDLNPVFFRGNPLRTPREIDIFAMRIIGKIEDMPPSQAMYITSAFALIGEDAVLFDADKLITVITEQWEKGVSESECASFALAAIEQYKQNKNTD